MEVLEASLRVCIMHLESPKVKFVTGDLSSPEQSKLQFELEGYLKCIKSYNLGNN